MRVGTDAVLLGAWAHIQSAEKILEIGTGSGVIALMLAQKNSMAKITALDIDTKSIEEATMNFKHCPWKERLICIEKSLQEYAKDALLHKTQDFIISNPPFFSNSTPAPNQSRHRARHTDTLSPSDFFDNCNKLLSPEGKISLILPFYNSTPWLLSAEKCKLFPSRITNVFSYPGKVQERVLIEFSYSQTGPEISTFFIRNAKDLGYTEAYKKLTGEFYL